MARTIADLDGFEGIKTEHLAEAIHYRSLDRENWVAEMKPFFLGASIGGFPYSGGIQADINGGRGWIYYSEILIVTILRREFVGYKKVNRNNAIVVCK